MLRPGTHVIESMAPSIFGHKDIELAITQLFRGEAKDPGIVFMCLCTVVDCIVYVYMQFRWCLCTCVKNLT